MKTPTHIRAAELAVHADHMRQALNSLVRECQELDLPKGSFIVSNLDEAAGLTDSAREYLEELSRTLQAKTE